jgi:hypothetical protein
VLLEPVTGQRASDIVSISSMNKMGKNKEDEKEGKLNK